MTDPSEFTRILEKYLRIQTYPVAVKVLQDRGDAPPGIPRVLDELHHKVLPCQCFGFARRNKLSFVMFKEDMFCPIGVVVMGLAERPDYVVNGSLSVNRYGRTIEAAARTEREMHCLELGKYVGIATAPLDECNFGMDLALVYVNAAQLTRLVQAAIYEEGGRFTVSVIPSAVCADVLVAVMKTGKCSIGLPCWGDRIHTGTNDNEMIFSIPAARFDEIAFGLIKTHEFGPKIPVPLPTSYEPAQLEVYAQYAKDLGLT